jgi:endo-1,4-beta-mannosidase
MKRTNFSFFALVCGACSLAALVPAICSAQAAPSDAATQGSEAQSADKLPVASLEGNYFSRGGKRFLPVGVNWVPAKAAMEWPYQWDPAAIEADFAKMHELGVNTVRLDLVWSWFEPRPDDYNPEAFKQLDFLVSLANRYKIYLHPELLVGGEVGEAYWDVPYRQGRDPHSDPYMLRLETDFVKELARRFSKSSAILSWDLTDEPPFWIVANTTTDSMAINWTRLIAGGIRRYDTMHPLVVGTATEDLDHGPFRPDNLRDDVDFFSVHPYTFGSKLFPDPMVSERQTYGAAYQTTLTGGAGRPVMIQELGASSAQIDPDAIAKWERASMYSGLAAGANGFLIWCATDAAPSQYSKVPYLRSPNETQFGITTWDGKERPAAKVLTSFSKITNALDLEGIEPAAAEVAILVPDEWSKRYGDESHFGLTGPEIAPYTSTEDGGAVPGQPLPNRAEENLRLQGAWLSSYVLAHRMGVKAAFPREYADWQKYPMLILPSPLTSTQSMMVHMHSDFWAKALSYVENGGALYASVSGDAAIPEMDSLFGARLVDRVPVQNVTLKVVAPFGNLKPGDTFTYSASTETGGQWGATLKVNGGQVIAVDQDGRPALVAHQVGKGKTLLCAYPIEIYIANQPSAFDGKEQTHRIYQSLLESAGVKRLVWTDQASVEASALNAQDHGYFVLVNHSSKPQHVSLETSLPVTSLAQVTADGQQSIHRQNAGWELDIQPYDGAVLAWK